MSDEPKPKIDLKARLGKRAVQTQAGAASIPPPIGLARGVPGRAPGGVPGVTRSAPFSQAPGPASSPSAAPAAFGSVPVQQAPVQVAPAAITIEMGEEVIEARKRARGKVLAAVGFAAAVAALIGFFVGGRYTNSQAAAGALQDAQQLAGKVEKANATVAKLAELLNKARTELREGKYPEAEVSGLGDLNIGITPEDIPIGLGRFKSTTRQAVIAYVKLAQEVNERKEALQNLLVGQKKAFEDLISDRDKPKVRWAAVVASGAEGPWLELAPVSEPFLVREEGKPWPSQLTVKRVGVQDGRQRVVDATLERVAKSELKTDFALPINPSTQSNVCPSDVIARVQSELFKLNTTLAGDDTPGVEKEGVTQLGERLLKALREIGGAPPPK